VIHLTFDLAEVMAGFERAHGNLGRNIPLALELSADLVAAEAKLTHDYIDRSHNLTDSIARDDVTGNYESGNLEIIVAAGEPYGLPLEVGAKPHRIEPRFRRALRWPVEGGFVFAKGVNHPGIRAREFLGKALDAKLPDITRTFEDATELSFAQAGFEVG
jgi:hypothetical protein